DSQVFITDHVSRKRGALTGIAGDTLACSRRSEHNAIIFFIFPERRFVVFSAKINNRIIILLELAEGKLSRIFLYHLVSVYSYLNAFPHPQKKLPPATAFSVFRLMYNIFYHILCTEKKRVSFYDTGLFFQAKG
ncbi:hypothetical protein VU07_01005, partial [Desulfobulbus sp. F4]|nr:hypothetical protein [Desulfobulbus sp. F4]